MIGLSAVGRLGLQPVRPSGGRINPADWFAGGAPGVAYDMTDLSAMFQDRGAYTPVTAVGQVAGVVRDLSRGLPAVSGPTTGWVKTLGDGTVTVTGDLVEITGATTTTRVTPPTWRVFRPGLTRVRIQVLSVSNTWLLYAAGVPEAVSSTGEHLSAAASQISTLDSVQGTGSITFRVLELTEIAGNHIQAPADSLRATVSRTPNDLGAELVVDGSPFVASSWTLASNWSVVAGKLQSNGSQGTFTYAFQPIAISNGKRYLVTVVVSSVNNSGLKIILSGGASTINATSPGTYSVSLPYFSTFLIQFESGAGTTCVIDSISVREVLDTPRNLPCLNFNGTRAYSAMSGQTLDLTSVDEVLVVAAVRSLSNADQIIVELSSSWLSVAGTFIFSRTSNSRFQMGSRGSTGSPIAQSLAFAAPDTVVLVARGKIATPEVRIQKNLEAPVTSSGAQGTGNYGNHTLNIGARNAASPSLFFNGDISRLTIRGISPTFPLSQSTLDQMVAWARAGNSAY